MVYWWDDIVKAAGRQWVRLARDQKRWRAEKDTTLSSGWKTIDLFKFLFIQR